MAMNDPITMSGCVRFQREIGALEGTFDRQPQLTDLSRGGLLQPIHVHARLCLVKDYVEKLSNLSEMQEYINLGPYPGLGTSNYNKTQVPG
jgi:hypothetical protein